ncbi:MAG: amidohydrolase family protein [Treponema sp.]|nr:amidohydrolase family protein [Treponema sp.]
MVIACDRIFDEETGGFTAGEIAVSGDRFGGPGGGETVDYRDYYALPGFIDLHTHGALGRAYSSADYETGLKAIRDGASQLTHLFNVMPPFLHRAPGLIGAAFDSENVKAELIADGEHVHPSAVRAAFRLFGDDRILLISDSLFSGLPDGIYSAGELGVRIEGGRARTSGGALAGATKTLGQCVVNAVKNIGIPLFSAAKCVSVNPAKQMGIFHERGSIRPGKIADMVLMDRDFNIRKIMVRGKFIPCQS